MMKFNINKLSDLEV